jgi:hypothetical protein
MNASERIKNANDLYKQLSLIARKLSFSDSNERPEAVVPPGKELQGLRAQMAAIEHQIALIRLIQSENRLRQHLWIAIPSLLSGALVTLLVQYIK